MQDSSTSRHIARKASINSVRYAAYVRSERDSAINFLMLHDEEVARVNIIAVVVQIDVSGMNGSVALDDGTGSIVGRVFGEKPTLKGINVGDVVMVVGRPREYLSEKYILIETVKKIAPLWATVRKYELGSSLLPVAAQNQQEDTPIQANPGSGIIALIKQLDKGEGVAVEDLMMQGVQDVDKQIDFMLREGDIFEIRPGRVKVLE